MLVASRLVLLLKGQFSQNQKYIFLSFLSYCVIAQNEVYIYNLFLLSLTLLPHLASNTHQTDTSSTLQNVKATPLFGRLKSRGSCWCHCSLTCVRIIILTIIFFVKHAVVVKAFLITVLGPYMNLSVHNTLIITVINCFFCPTPSHPNGWLTQHSGRIFLMWASIFDLIPGIV